MTVSQMITELAAELGEIEGDADVDTVFLTWIRETVQDILRNGEWFFMGGTFALQTDIGESSYNLPTDVGDIKAVQRDDTGQKLHFTRIESLAKAGERIGGTSTSSPDYWLYESMVGGVTKIRLYPTPDAAYSLTIYYEKADPNLATTSATIPLPQDFFPVLKDKVRFLYYTQAGHPSARDFLLMYENGLLRLRARYEQPRDEVIRHGYNDLPDEAGGFPMPQFPANYPRVY